MANLHAVYIFRGVLCALLLLPSWAGAMTFSACVDDIRQQAITQHGADNTAQVDAFFALVTELPQVIAADRKQAEFTQSFEDYYTRRVTEARIETGRRLKDEYARLYRDIAARYQVQPAYLLALWGLETNFGGYMGKLNIPSALATLACDQRRSSFFRGELLAATQVAVRGDIAPETMLGSWAGAMGHMQFMPTTYLAHAVDFDGDGKANVYASVGDAMASAANYLRHSGWQPGYRWGREVRLPEGFDYSLARSDNWQPLHAWRGLGVTDTQGQLLADLPLQSAILLPSGHKGPVFVVYPNFEVIMKWNRSQNYAIAVGRLADRIAGLGALSTPFPPADTVRFRTDDLKQLQTALTAQGYDTRGVDGVLGPATRQAIRAYQQDHQLIADGFPDADLLRALTGS